MVCDLRHWAPNEPFPSPVPARVVPRADLKKTGSFAGPPSPRVAPGRGRAATMSRAPATDMPSSWRALIYLNEIRPFALSRSLELLQNLPMFRESAAAMLAPQQRSVVLHVEDAAASGNQLTVEAGFLPDLGRQTGGPGIVVSLVAIGDLDLHVLNSTIDCCGRFTPPWLMMPESSTHRNRGTPSERVPATRMRGSVVSQTGVKPLDHSCRSNRQRLTMLPPA